jgi:hypothetical protein
MIHFAPWKMEGQLDATMKRMKSMTAMTLEVFATKEPDDKDRADLNVLVKQSEEYVKGLEKELQLAAKTDMRKYRTIKQAIRVQVEYREALLKILAR